MLRRSLLLLTAFWALLAPLAAQDSKVAATTRFVPATARPGDEVTLEVELAIDDGWHVYGRLEETGIPPSLTLTDAAGLTPEGKTDVPFGVPHESFGLKSYWVVGRAVLKQKLRVPTSASGTLAITGRVDYMVCDEESCLPPDQLEIRAALTIDAPAAPAAPAEPAEPTEDVKVTAAARFVPATARPGDTVVLEVALRILDGWHVYGRDESTGIPPTLTLTDAAGLATEGPTDVPAGEMHEAFGVASYWVKERALLRQTFRIPTDAAPGPLELRAHLESMACNDEMCDPPSGVDLTARLVVDPNAAPAAAPAAPTPGVGLQDPFELLTGPPQPTFAPRVEPTAARAGETVDVVVAVTVPAGYHLYGAKDPDPTKLVAVATAPLVARGTNHLPDGEPHQLGKLVNAWLTGTFEIRQAFDVPNDAKPGGTTLKLRLEYQLCDESTCLPVKPYEFELPLTIEAGAARAQHAASAAPPPLDEEGDDEFGSLWSLIFAAIGAGLFALVMPCTYPMIPITISFFTKQAAARGGRVASLSLAYGAGIVAVFILIGVLVGPAIVPFARHWLVNLVIAVLFLLFGLSLFGLINLQPPRFLMNAASKASMQGGYHGVFLMGATLVITSFTCTAPFVGTLLGSAASHGLSSIVIGMTVFGLTMAIPFVVLSLVPGRMQAMPRAGEWMNTLKVTLGFIEVAASLKFFSNAEMVWRIGALPRELFLLLWAATFFVAGLFLLGMFRLKDAEPSIGSGRMTAGLGVMLFAGYCVFGALGFRMDNIMTAIVPNYSAPMVRAEAVGSAEGASVPERKTHTIVKDDFDAGLALAREQGKLLLVNFTGYT